MEETEEPTEPIEAGTSSSTGGSSTSGGSTILTLKDLMDLPSQILPPETYAHLKNARKEALLALFSLWQALQKSAAPNDGKRTRKHIHIE